MNPPTGPQLDQIKQAIFRGQKVQAIKLHREATGLGLKESKEAIEELEAQLRQTEEHNFVKGAAKGGCLSVLVLATIFGAGLLTALAR